MLTLEQLRAELAQVKSYPGWRFDAYQHRIALLGVWVAIKAELPNSYRPGETIHVSIETPVPPVVRTAGDFHEWLFWRCQHIVIHELCEFHQVGGRLYANPHAGGFNRNPTDE